MNSPLISVLIPTYNVEKFVEEAVRSVMNQSYRNLEIIAVDDCSTDGTYEVLQILAKEDQRIRLFRNDKNRRIAETLNCAFSVSKGEFIGRVDADDINMPDRFESQLKHILNNPAIDLIGVNYIIIDEKGNEIQRERHLTDFGSIRTATRYVSPVPHFWLARRKVYEVVNGYRMAGVEDYDFILRAIDHGFKISNLPEFLYLHRIRGGNTATSTGLSQKKLFKYVQFLHRERVNNSRNEDSYSDESLRQRLKTNLFEAKTYKIACQLHHRHILTKADKKLVSFAYLVVALLFSPRYLLGDKLNRLQYKRLFNRQ